jgi:hypothetical protein
MNSSSIWKLFSQVKLNYVKPIPKSYNSIQLKVPKNRSKRILSKLLNKFVPRKSKALEVPLSTPVSPIKGALPNYKPIKKRQSEQLRFFSPPPQPIPNIELEKPQIV